jgi:hypothetical protein
MHGQVVIEPNGGQGLGKAGDPDNMRMTQAATFAVNATPYEGNYPTGVWTSNATGTDTWYYGTYPVMDGNWCEPRSRVGPPPQSFALCLTFRSQQCKHILVFGRSFGDAFWFFGSPFWFFFRSKWNEDCTNWCSLGPFPGWVWSVDE